MIFKTIRNNHILLFFALGALLAFIVLPFFWTKVSLNNELELPFFFMENWFNGTNVFHFTLGVLFQLCNSIVLLSIGNELKLFPKNKAYVPLVYFVLSIVVYESLYFNPIHLTTLFSLSVLRLILGLQVFQSVNYHLLTIGALVCISGTIYPPFFLLTLAALIAILIIRPFRIREIIIYLIGLILPLIYYISILYLGNNMNALPMPNEWNYQIENPLFESVLNHSTILLIILLAVFTIFYLFLNSTKMAVRNRIFFNVWIVFLLAGCIMFLLPYTNLFSIYMTCIPFLTLFNAYYLSASSKTWQVEALLIIVVILSFMANIGF